MSSGFNKVRPTKPNLDKLKKKRNFADRGARLLDLKRQQLLSEFKKQLDKYTEKRKATREKIIQGYDKLNKTYMQYGKRRIKLLANMNQIHYEPTVNINYVNYMGIDMPKIQLDILEKEQLPSYSFQETPIEFDNTINHIKEILEDIIKMAELDQILFHFAFNYQKVQRRINALESIIIPNVDCEINSIEEILEDIEREELIQMKEIKNTLTEKQLKLSKKQKDENK